jgi:hypothetical protein
LPGVAPQTFFGPAQIRKRRTEWGASVLQARHDAAMARFADAAAAWLVIGHCDGVAAFESAYRRVTDGAADPSRALVVRWAEPSDEAPLTPEERAALALVRTPSRR